MSRNLLRAGLALAVCLLCTPAAAATISGLTISNGSTNVFDDLGAIGSVAQSSTSVLASGATGFDMRYAASVGADTGGAGGGSYTQNFTGNFTISFTMTQTAGWTWAVSVDVVRAGALTIITDGTGNANVTLNGLTVTHSGAGVLGASLDLGAVGTASNAATPNQNVDQGFSQASTATINGVGTGAAQVVTLVFTFTASATTVDPNGGLVQGDEAGLRMGLDSALGAFEADDYPGGTRPNTSARTIANDGILVTAALLPEPAAEALLAVGLIGLAWFDRKRTRR
jgi:hypothetical protein